MRLQWFMRMFLFFASVLVVLFIIWRLQWNQDNTVNELNSQRLTRCIQMLRNLRLDNVKLNIELVKLNKNSELESLKNSMKDVERIHKIKNMAGEHYRSLLKDVSGLAEVDNYSTWRQQEFKNLSILVQSRFEVLQNPPNWLKARQLLCKFEKECGFGCQLHHIAYCFIVAYSTQRMLVLDYQYWVYGDVWPKVFLPLSDTSTLLKNIPIDNWPGDPSSQIIYLPPIDFVQPRPYFLPQMIPDDLATRLTVLHGDPIVWWIGQIFKYMFRPQLSTSNLLDDYANELKFQKPIVGVHIRRTDKLYGEASLHMVDEYMVHVEEFYKRKELSGEVNRKRIYLATDEPTVFYEIKHNYPEYEIIGSVNISNTASVKSRNSKEAINGIIVDLHFLSLSDHLVCTFSSQFCRVAYELMNSLYPDASTRFTSLDDIYYFGGQTKNINEAVLPHKADGSKEIDLQVKDQIAVHGNHWNGYSKGTNLRTGLLGLYPTFKVIPKIKTATITDSKTIISQDGKNKNN